MSPAPVRQPSDRKKKATKKVASTSTARKVIAATPKSTEKGGEVIETAVTIKGQRYQIRATKWLVLKVMKGSALITDWAEDRDEDDKIEPHELMDLAEVYETVVKLFSAQDGFAGTRKTDKAPARKARASSRDRILEGLDDGTLDFEDFTPAFKELSAVRESAGGRPLG